MAYCMLSGVSKLPKSKAEQKPDRSGKRRGPFEKVDIAMAYNSNIAPHVSSAGIGQVIVDTFADLKAGFEKRAVFRRTYGELNTRSDRELADIGITRDMIRAIARQAADAA